MEHKKQTTESLLESLIFLVGKEVIIPLFKKLIEKHEDKTGIETTATDGGGLPPDPTHPKP
jgi:hypothetical protein